MKKEDIKVGVSFVWTGYYPFNFALTETINKKIKFTIKNIDELDWLPPSVYCDIDTNDSDGLLFLSDYLDCEEGPTKGMYRVGAYEEDIVNWEIVENVIDKSTDYPHICPHCGGSAYIGLFSVDCRSGCKTAIL